MDPYRSSARFTPSLGARVRWARVLAWSAQLVVLVVGITCALLSQAYAELAARSAPLVIVRQSRAPPAPKCLSHGGITQLSATDFSVTPAYLNHVLEQQAELMTQARIVPVTLENHVIGIELFAVRPGSELAALGFENGDVVLSINDYDLASPESSLEAYARLREMDWLRVVVRRHGEAVVLHYYLRD